MTAAQLKASILDQAIRGHLTAKWREERKRRGEGEENAVELLARLTAARNAASPKKGKPQRTQGSIFCNFSVPCA